MKFPTWAGLGLALFISLTLGAALPPSGTGQIVYLDGQVTVNGKPAVEGALLKGPVTLKTGANSTLEVVFDGRNVFRLGPTTVARIDFAQAQKQVNVDRGSFSAVLKQLAVATGADASFTLRTPTANAGVRGTSFHVMVDDASTYFCACNGQVGLDDGVAKDAEVLTNAHHGARIFTKDAGGNVVVTVAGLQGHTDEGMQKLADRISEKIDWTKPDLKHGQ